MFYSPPPHLHHCTVGDRLICLDLRTDRYFQLEEPLRTPFLDALSGRSARSPSVTRLISSGLLREQAAPYTAPALPPVVTDSLIEAGPPCPPAWSHVPEITLLVAHAMYGVKVTPLHTLLARAARTRRISLIQTDTPPIAVRFNESRRMVPLPRVCLHDSLAMKAFLQRRGVSATLVFGIALNPFSAHCWLQIGSTVLNDTLDRVARHTPLLAV